MENTVETLTTLATTYGLRVLGAILILIVGRIVARIVRNAIRRVLERRETDPSLVGFVSSLASTLVIVVAVSAALAKFGVETASLVAVLGAAGFAIGFALQGSLSNFASGIMLLVFRPFKVGDWIEAAGVSGSVKEIQLFNTIVATGDNIRITIPNGKVYGDVIKNYSAHDTRRVDLVVGIGYGSSIPKAMELVHGLIKKEARALTDPAPMIAVSELADSSVNLVIRVWTKTPDYWGVRFDLTQNIKHSFDENGIEIPFPQRVVHHVNEPAA